MMRSYIPRRAFPSPQPETRPLVKCSTSTGQLFIFIIAVFVHLSLGLAGTPPAHCSPRFGWVPLTVSNQDPALAYTG